MAKLLLVDDNQELLGIQGEFLRMAGHGKRPDTTSCLGNRHSSGKL